MSQFSIMTWKAAQAIGYGRNLALDVEAKLPTGTQKRLAEERLEILNELLAQDMLVKLTKGEFSFEIDPEESLTVREISARTGMDRTEVSTHLEHLEPLGLVSYYGPSKIDTIFWRKISDNPKKRGQIKPFAHMSHYVRDFLYGKPKEEIVDVLREVLETQSLLVRKSYF